MAFAVSIPFFSHFHIKKNHIIISVTPAVCVNKLLATVKSIALCLYIFFIDNILLEYIYILLVIITYGYVQFLYLLLIIIKLSKIHYTKILTYNLFCAQKDILYAHKSKSRRCLYPIRAFNMCYISHANQKRGISYKSKKVRQAKADAPKTQRPDLSPDKILTKNGNMKTEHMHFYLKL